MTTLPLHLGQSSRLDRPAGPARHRVLALFVSVSLVLAACAGGTDTISSPSSSSSSSSVSATAADEAPLAKGGNEVEELLTGEPTDQFGASAAAVESGSAPVDQDQPQSGLAAQIEFIGNSVGGPAEVSADPQPVSIAMPTLGIESAPVSAVGVEANGDMEIPGASEVGWYRFGPNPGDTGSAVLAAHIAFNGEDGVFRDLTDMEPGETFSVGFSDGSAREFVVIGLRQYSKNDIPLEDFFARDGTPRLILITCGGRFNRAVQSYDDNVVVISVPVDFGANAS